MYLPPSVAYALWRPLRELLARHRADGGHIRPDVVTALDALRAAAYGHMSQTPPGIGTSAHHQARDHPVTLVTSDALAGRLGVTRRHTYRLAAREGIAPTTRGRWTPEDAERLVQAYRRTR